MIFLGLREISRMLQTSEDFNKYKSNLRKSAVGQLVHGLTDSQQGYWIGSAAYEVKKPLVIITETLSDAKNMMYDLLNFFQNGEVDYLPPREIMLHGLYAKSYELTEERIKVLSRLVKGDIRCLILPIETLSQKMIPMDVFKNAHMEIKVGINYDHNELINKLVLLGYERVDLVQGSGQFSARGDILDIYPFYFSNPVRIEFFDDEIETMRYFDAASQRSRGTIHDLIIPPARELIADDKRRQRAIGRLSNHGEEYIQMLSAKGKRNAARKLKDLVDEWVSYLKNDLWSVDLDKLQPFFYENQASIVEYFNDEPLIIVSEPVKVFETLKRLEEERLNNLTELLDLGKAVPGLQDINFSIQEVLELIKSHNVTYLSSLPREIPNTELINIVSFTGKSVPPFHGKIKLLLDEYKAWKKRGYTVVFAVSSSERANRLKEYLWEEKIEIPLIKNIDSFDEINGKSFITLGSFAKGFEIPSIKLTVISDEEIFGRKKHGKVLRTFKEGTKVGHYGELKVGDFVVHVQHGIGKYLGIEHLKVGGVYRDYLNIQYYGQDKLYVPTDQVELIQKYVGAEGHRPKLHKLGGTDWQKVKSRVKESVQEMAKQLLELYASRETLKGHAFPPDDNLQELFEEAFPYTETPDQLKAIEDTKRDMQKPKPMDRLICGDVGYGKTEVALRAAFKAVRDSKQVAVLVPTTVLAQQHYKTFIERFADFPVVIDTLSRFRTNREQKQVVEGLEKGTIDIVIGTHRLLSTDIKFKNLGLLVIDEEQRFGVGHKEKIKQIRKNVDVLTLTATPIPRTMHMALAGVRDMSVIETPPEDRYPVQTYVIEYSDNLVRDAIRKELDRGGQVYYIHNKIEDIDKVRMHLEKMIPDASIGVAHGRMREDELEKVMLNFIEGNYQVLLCTTIVENGLDISNVNTLIVDEADKLGLSQLYQIRGRVGRTNRIAYAYFTYRKNKILNQQAEKRLATIREFTEFGSGFKIAKRDLEIRGAGNILGPEQHGHMLAIGFDLYCRLLEDAVRQLKGERQKEKDKEALEIEVNVSAYVSNKYVPDSSQIMDVYQELGSCETIEEVQSIEESLIDRYGEMPEESRNLIILTRIRVMAKQLMVTKIKHVGDEIEICFAPAFSVKGEKLLELARGMDRRVSFSGARGLVIKLRTNKLNQKEILDLLENIFLKLAALEGKH
ncbi:MAG: transcription-repair coupling factor [Clostridia bacterium]|nr:transcription-repair coupling factor [Clostridia bacterium]